MEGSRRAESEYTIRVGKGKIRILDISAPIETTLTATFRYVEVEDRTIYIALSYRWSSKARNRIVYIDGYEHFITEDLFEAMRRMAGSSGASVWIDAICINQKDIIEKNIQVAQMDQIYKGAETVFVWLGQADASTEIVFKFMSGFGTDFRSDRYNATTFKSFMSSADDNYWIAVLDLLNREWWSRVWMFQEVVLARNIHIHCGRFACIWDVLTSFAGAVIRGRREWGHPDLWPIPKHRDMIYIRAAPIFNYAVVRRNYLNIAILPSLTDALCVRRVGFATNPKDKIYALLGVCREEQTLPREKRHIYYAQEPFNIPQKPAGPHFEIEYDEKHSITEVYKGVVFHIVGKCKHLELLAHCKNPGRENGMPLWVSNWRVPRTTNPLVEPGTWGRRYYASGEDCGARLEPGRHPNEVMTVGFFVDIITEVASQNTTEGAGPAEWQAWADIAAECATNHLGEIDSLVHMRNGFYQGKGNLYDAFLRTLAVGRIDDDQELNSNGLSPAVLDDKDLDSIWYAASQDALLHRHFGITEHLLMAVFAPGTRVGDAVFILAGGDVPFVLRDVEDGAKVIVGECYIRGFMHGEIRDFRRSGWDGKGVQEELIRLR